ncbi:Transglutaminase domain-containing protein [Gammaproteobacteria bacterium]
MSFIAFLRQTGLRRFIASLVLLTFTSLTLQPLQAVAQIRLEQSRLESKLEQQRSAVRETPQGGGEQYAKLLDDLKETAKRGRDKTQKGQTAKDEAKALRQQKKQLDALESQVEQDFAATEADLKAKNLPAEILSRHQAAVQAFKAKRDEFKSQFKTLEGADDKDDESSRGQRVGDLATWLDKNQKGKPHTKTDPRKLPFRTPDSKVRAPIETEAGYQAHIGLTGQKSMHKKDTLIPGTHLKSLDIAPPSDADLAPTEDVQITPAIQAKAAELGKNAVKISNWVRNNIEFIPTFGSIQGSDMTLQTLRGNAFDTASLEIALLRASNIPARYVYGTIQIPVDKAMNWVGGVTKPEAALNLMGQGGIPSIGLETGGQISHIKLEHVWVEAWVDYSASRGTGIRPGDSWVPMDGSYKQYTYTQGMDIKTAVPLDANSLLTQAQAGATVNEAEGWVQNLNQTNIQAALTSYQTQVQTFINNTKPNATVGDVLGGKKIVQIDYPNLAPSLPYKRLITGSKLSSLPDMLRWKYRTSLYSDANSYALGGGDMASISQSTPKLAGKKITISFIPATQADTDLINSYLPKPHADGTPIQPSELPTSLPGYLLNLKPEIRVDGQVVSQGTTTVTMGQELLQATAIYNPATGWEEGGANIPIAGEYHAIALDLQGIGSGQLAAHKAKLEATKSKFAQFQANPNDTTPIANLTKEDLAGDLLYTGILGYFASVVGSDTLAAKTGKTVVNYRMPSYGAFMAEAAPHYFFGIVRSVSFPGVVMDVDRVFTQAVAKDNDNAKLIAYMRQTGLATSAFEHAVPERLFADPAKPLTDPSQPQGISAVKALAIAASQGQKICTLNAKNQAYHASIVASLGTNEEIKAEISNALAAGKEVTVHQANISAYGWTGMGYIILDPATGAGAYKISGGMNGGSLSMEFDNLILLAGAINPEKWPFYAKELFVKFAPMLNEGERIEMLKIIDRILMEEEVMAVSGIWPSYILSVIFVIMYTPDLGCATLSPCLDYDSQSMALWEFLWY